MPYRRSIDEPTGPLQPVCRHLRSKAVFVAGRMEPPADVEEMGSGHCWCNRTQHVLGPDHRTVDRRECNGSRECYEPTL